MVRPHGPENRCCVGCALRAGEEIIRGAEPLEPLGERLPFRQGQFAIEWPVGMDTHAGPHQYRVGEPRGSQEPLQLAAYLVSVAIWFALSSIDIKPKGFDAEHIVSTTRGSLPERRQSVIDRCATIVSSL